MMYVYGVHLNLNCVLMIILVMILPILGLLFWLENTLSQWKERVRISDEVNSLFYEQGAHPACTFCGSLSDIVSRCSRCNDAKYCSNSCYDMHWRFCHKYECVEIEGSQDESSSHGTHCLAMVPENDKYLFNVFNEVEKKGYKEDFYYIEGGENSVKLKEHGNGIVSNNDGCVVCGNPPSKVCSRCKAIKYCSQTCQHFDWRSRHKFQCLAEKQNSTQLAEVVNLKNSYEGEEDKADSSSHLRLELYTGNTNSRALILSQEVANNAQKEVEEQLRNLKEELAKIKNENISLRLHRDEWEVRARNSIDRLYSFRKENEHQVFILKHENELMSNAEKQARQMVKSLSQRLHCLQIAMESGVEQRRKQEHIHMLQGCSICLTNEKNMAFGCGHMTCLECGSKIRKCHICRTKITTRIRLFSD